MPTLPNMALVTPAPGGDSGTWDDKINACFALIDAHDHTSGKGVLIASAALDIDADVAWGGFGITGLGKLSFTTIAAPSTGSKALFVSSADNELYWRTNSGTNVKLTSGASINTTLVGGIVGDYSTVGAEVAYSDADQVYTFKDQSSPSKKWARIAGGAIRVYEHDTTESVYVELAAPAALGASYTITLPTAAPASTSVMQTTSGGVSSFVSTRARTYNIGGGAAQQTTGSGHTYSATTNQWTFAANAGQISFQLPVVEGDVVTAWTAKMSKGTAATTTLAAQLWAYDITTGARTQVGSTQSNNANAPGAISLGESGLSRTVAANEAFFVLTSLSSTLAAGDILFGGSVTKTEALL